jgi:hypothetical protein
VFKKRSFQREVIKAVHDNDLEDFLSSIGILEDIISGKYQCVNCKKTITLNSIGAIYPENNRINVICDMHSCLSNFDFSIEEGNG